VFDLLLGILMATEAAKKIPYTAIVPDGAFSYPIEAVNETRWFGFLLLPQFTLLAFSSALDPLRVANQLAQKPLYGWHVVSETGEPVASSSGLAVNVDGDIASVTPGLPLFVCSGNDGQKAASKRVLSALRAHVRFGGTVGGICTGAATLARAGMLEGKRFTMHWENQPGFVEAFHGMEPTSARVEQDGDLLTCSGGSAATGMILEIIRQDYGQDFAIAVADMCLYDLDDTQKTSQRSSIAKAIDSRNGRLLNVLRAMHANVEDPLTLNKLAEDAGISRRQMERLFINVLGETPSETYRNIKLDKARALIAETDLTVTEIAFATGFNSAGIMTRHYKARFGETPYGKRKGKIER